jgi:hypothetical protein
MRCCVSYLFYILHFARWLDLLARAERFKTRLAACIAPPHTSTQSVCNGSSKVAVKRAVILFVCSASALPVDSLISLSPSRATPLAFSLALTRPRKYRTRLQKQTATCARNARTFRTGQMKGPKRYQRLLPLPFVI